MFCWLLCSRLMIWVICIVYCCWILLLILFLIWMILFWWRNICVVWCWCRLNGVWGCWVRSWVVSGGFLCWLWMWKFLRIWLFVVCGLNFCLCWRLRRSCLIWFSMCVWVCSFRVSCVVVWVLCCMRFVCVIWWIWVIWWCVSCGNGGGWFCWVYLIWKLVMKWSVSISILSVIICVWWLWKLMWLWIFLLSWLSIVKGVGLLRFSFVWLSVSSWCLCLMNIWMCLIVCWLIGWWSLGFCWRKCRCFMWIVRKIGFVLYCRWLSSGCVVWCFCWCVVCWCCLRMCWRRGMCCWLNWLMCCLLVCCLWRLWLFSWMIWRFVCWVSLWCFVVRKWRCCMKSRVMWSVKWCVSCLNLRYCWWWVCICVMIGVSVVLILSWLRWFFLIGWFRRFGVSWWMVICCCLCWISCGLFEVCLGLLMGCCWFCFLIGWDWCF